VQLTPLSTHWAPRKKNKKRVQSFSDTVYISKQRKTTVGLGQSSFHPACTPLKASKWPVTGRNFSRHTGTQKDCM